MERKKLPNSFWVLLVSGIFIVMVVVLASLYDWFKTAKFEPDKTPNSCKIVSESKAVPETSPVLFDWDRFESGLSLIALKKESGEVQTQKVLSSSTNSAKYLIYKLSSFGTLCESKDQSCMISEISRISKDILLFNKTASLKQEWYLSFLPIRNNFIPIPIRQCGAPEAGKTKFFFHSETSKIVSLDLKNSQFTEIDLKTFIREKNKAESISIQNRLIVNGGMLEAECLKTNRPLADGFMFSNALVIWPKKTASFSEELWIYRSVGAAEGFSWTKGETVDMKAYKDGYIAKMSQFANYLLVSFFNTITKKYNNSVYQVGVKLIELKTQFASEKPAAFTSSYGNDTNLIYEVGKSPRLLTYLVKQNKVVPLVKMDKSEFTSETKVITNYQNNSILLIDNVAAAEKNIYQLSCQSLE